MFVLFLLKDSDVNAENKENAIQEYAYGPSVKNWEKKKQICGTCEYYNIRSQACWIALRMVLVWMRVAKLVIAKS